MPWEKSFNVDDAVSKAMELFWQKGYAESSMAELLAVTGLSRGSLYNAFGGKRNLFIKALLKYDAEQRCAMLAKLEEMDNSLEALESFLKHMVATVRDDPDKKGCFLVNTSLDLYAHDEETVSIVQSAMKDLLSFFNRMIVKGQADGHIPLSVDADKTANTILGVATGIRVLGRGAVALEVLEPMVTDTMKLLGCESGTAKAAE